MSHDPIYAASVEFAIILSHRGLEAATRAPRSGSGIRRRLLAFRAWLNPAMPGGGGVRSASTAIDQRRPANQVCRSSRDLGQTVPW
jgi:hypothetical protein